MELQDRVAVVTGAAVGTGRAIAHRLTQGGATVVLSDVSDGSEALRAIRDAGGRAEFVAADLTTTEGVESVVDFAVATFDRLDILVNNAGGIPYDTPGFPRVGPADWGGVLRPQLAGAAAGDPARARGGGRRRGQHRLDRRAG